MRDKRTYWGPSDYAKRNPYVVIELNVLTDEYQEAAARATRKAAENYIDNVGGGYRNIAEVMTRNQWRKDERNPANA